MFSFFKITPKERSVKIRKKYGTIYTNPPKSRRVIFHLGTLIVLLGMVYLAYLYKPLVVSIIRYKSNYNKATTDVVSLEKNNITEEDESYYILIPKISAESKIIENVSPYNSDEYLAVLANDEVAQSNTSSPPGSGKNNTTYLFAHSTQQGINMVRKNSVFYLLGELINNDLVYINYRGSFYTYKVYDKKIISYKEAEYLNYKDENREVLILQTCWPIGTNWKRLLIFTERI